MKRKISTTLAVTLITSQMQGIAFAQDSIDQTNKENEKPVVETSIDNNIEVKEEAAEDVQQTQEETKEDISKTVVDNYKVTGKLELDINFDMPIKHTTKDITDINVVLKSSVGEVASVSLGKDTTTGTIEASNIKYSLEALNGQKKSLEDGDTEVSFYHLTFENLSLDNYSLEISGQGYKDVVIDDIEILTTSKRVSLGTSDNTIVLDDNGTTETSDDVVEEYAGVFLAGNIDGDDTVTQEDYNELKNAIKGAKAQAKSIKNLDLNRDGKVDITDLSYVHNNIGKAVGQARIEDTDVIVNPDNTDIPITEDINVDGNIKDLLKDNGASVKLTHNKLGEDGQVLPISEENPISIPIVLNKSRARSTTNVEQIVIKAPSETAPDSGNITIPGAGEGGEPLVVKFSGENVRTLRTGEDEIVVDLGKQVAVSQITINVTGGRGNKNLAEIAKVDFLNNVYKELPKPKMNVPVINNFTSATAVGNEHLVLGWDHEPNVTGYELKVQEVNENGGVISTSTYRTNENTLKIDNVNGYSIYRVSIQSLNGSEWKSGYKDEQEGYISTKTGTTNLETNLNDKDGKPDNVDKNYMTQAWNSNTGNLDQKAESTVEDAYTDTLKGANNYGADSIIELQVIPETAPEGPEGISVKGTYKGLNITWKSHKKAKDYDLYYRKVGEGAWIKANDPNEPKYVDSNDTNDIPDGVTNISLDKKADTDELIRGTSYKIKGLEDQTTYEIKMTATNHHGTGGLSQTYIGATSKINPPATHNYKLINSSKGVNEITNHIESVEFTQGKADDVDAVVDNDYTTVWEYSDWDARGGAPIVNFDKEYTIKDIKVVRRLDVDELTHDIKVQYYDESAQQWKTASASWNTTNSDKLLNISLDEPITTKRIKVGISVYPKVGWGDYRRAVTISEMKFYEYDSLEDEVYGLFKDKLMLELNTDVTQEKIDELRKRANTIDPVNMVYHPNQTQILSDLQRAQDLLDDVKLNDDIKVIDPDISNHWKGTNNIGQSNDWQALGVAVKPGDKINIYIGSDRAAQDTQFELAITQYNGESETAYKVYNQSLKIGKNEIVIPETGFNMDYEKGGNLYIRFKNAKFDIKDNVQVRVSGGTEIPHLDLNNIIADESKEAEAKEKIRVYLKELKSYVSTLPDRYPDTEDKANNIYKYDPETSILNATDIEGDRFTLSLAADQVLKGIQSGLSSEDAQVDRLYNTLRAWEQLMEISYVQQGLLEEPIDFDGNGKIDDTKLEELNGKSENQFFNENRAPRNRMNIKYQRMFTGAFMYASSHHVGIGYGSIAGMMQGVPFEFDENGDLVNTDGNLFGWGISHEVGHVHDRPGLTYAETTNNILALITQTFNDIETSRVEGAMESVYDRVTSGSVGTPKGLTGLAMYWQLHLAYDNNNTYDMIKDNTDGDITNDTFFAKLYRVTREKGIAPSEAGYDQTAQTFIIRSSDAVGKDLREFFARWGIVASPKTNEYLDKMNYEKEDKAIFYLNDEARRLRLKAIQSNTLSSLNMAKDTTVEGNFGDGITDKSYISKNSVPLEFKVNKDNDKILGYEIIRKESTSTGTKETPVGFVQRSQDGDVTKYVDVIDAANNRTFEYKVRAYDYNLNVTETFDVGTVKVKHDGTIAKSNFTFDTNTRGVDDVVNENTGHGQVEDGSINNIKDNNKDTVYNASKATDSNGNVVSGDPYVTIDMGTSKSVVGLKYTPGNTQTKKFSLKNIFKKRETTYSPISNYEVLVSDDGKNWTKAHSGKFDTTKENVIYFNESGSSDNSQLWTYNAKYVKLVAKGAQTISIAELDILGPPGDNIEIGMDNNDQVYKNGVGRLKSDYTYAEGKIIPKGSIVVMGEYTGDPAYNVPLILNEDGENFALQAQSILLANLPEDSQLGEVAEGNFIYWITPEQQENLVDGEVNIKGKAIKAELYRYNKLNSEGVPVGQRLVSDTFLVDLPEDLANLPIIDLNSNKARTLTNYDNVIEVDSKTTQATFENR